MNSDRDTLMAERRFGYGYAGRMPRGQDWEGEDQDALDGIDDRDSVEIEEEAQLMREIAGDYAEQPFDDDVDDELNSSVADSYIDNPPSEDDDEDYEIAAEDISVGQTESISDSHKEKLLDARRSARLSSLPAINYNEEKQFELMQEKLISGLKLKGQATKTETLKKIANKEEQLFNSEKLRVLLHLRNPIEPYPTTVRTLNALSDLSDNVLLTDENDPGAEYVNEVNEGVSLDEIIEASKGYVYEKPYDEIEEILDDRQRRKIEYLEKRNKELWNISMGLNADGSHKAKAIIESKSEDVSPGLKTIQAFLDQKSKLDSKVREDEVKSSVMKKTAIQDCRCVLCGITIQSGRSMYVRFTPKSQCFVSECLRCHNDNSESKYSHEKKRGSNSVTTRSVTSAKMTKEEKLEEDTLIMENRLSQEVNLLEPKKSLDTLGTRIIKSLQDENAQFERAVNPATTFKPIVLARKIEEMVTRMLSLTNELGSDLVKDIIRINFPLDSYLSLYKNKFNKQAGLIEKMKVTLHNTKPQKPVKNAIMLGAQEELREKIDNIMPEWEKHVGRSFQSMDSALQRLFEVHRISEIENLNKHYRDLGEKTYATQYLFYQQQTKEFASNKKKTTDMLKYRNRYGCIVLQIGIIKKIIITIIDKIKLSSYLNAEVNQGLQSTVSVNGVTISNPVEHNHLTGILANLQSKFLKATFHDFLSDVGIVHSHKCNNISDTITFIESTMGAHWEKHGYYKYLSHPDTLMGVYTAFIVTDPIQKTEVLELISEYLEGLSEFMKLGGTQIDYSHEHGTLMEKIRAFRDTKSLVDRMVKPKLQYGTYSHPKPNSGSSAHLAFERLTLSEQESVNAFLSEHTEPGSGQSGGGSYVPELTADSKHYYLIPKSGGLYCNVKGYTQLKGTVLLSQGVYTYKVERSTGKSYPYECQTVQDTTRTGPTANFKCKCGGFYHIDRRCLNRDF